MIQILHPCPPPQGAGRAGTWRRSGLKGCYFGEHGRLEFRWEIFNLLNPATFDVSNRVFGTPNFGCMFSAQGVREM